MILIAALAVVPLVGIGVNADAAISSAPAAAAQAVRPALLPVPLQQGDSGPAVGLWQQDLNAFINFPPPSCRPTLHVDNSFGPLTTAATKCFQSARGLTRDGIVGPKTRGEMCDFLASTPDTPGHHDLHHRTCQ